MLSKIREFLESCIPLKKQKLQDQTQGTDRQDENPGEGGGNENTEDTAEKKALTSFQVSKQKGFVKELIDFIRDLIIIVLAVLVIRTFFVMPFQINGQSMANSYYDKEFILVDRLSYRNLPLVGNIRDVQRGDVVIFAPGISQNRKYFIKRVIGLPGETLKIDGGRVFVQKVGTSTFVELEEGSYLSAKNNKRTMVQGKLDTFTYTIPEDRYFVMGDNRAHSTDSRTCFQSCSVRTNFIAPGEITGRLYMDLGYFNFRDFSFDHPTLGVNTAPRFFSSPGIHLYD